MKRILLSACVVLLVLIVIIGMTTVSFSWFAPDEASGTGLQFSETTSVRSQDCTCSTYYGTMNSDTGVVSYSNTPLSSQTVAAGSTAYFRTVIKNNNVKYDSNVSLFLVFSSIPSSTNYDLAVTLPTNSYRTFSSSDKQIHIIRNAYVSAFDNEKIGTGEIVVEWFVKTSGGSLTISNSNIKLVYN